MKPKYIYSSHRTRRIAKIRKQRQKYPSLAKKIITTSDIVLQVLDSRFIEDTRNKEIEEEIKSQKKQIIFVLNKADLIDKRKIKKETLKEIFPYVFVSSTEREGSKELRNLIKRAAKNITKKETRVIKGEKIKEKGGEDKISVGVIGYPNVGKSSLINFLIGKSSAGVGSDAGFTKGIQKLKLTPEIILLDSPGVIPEKEYSGVQTEKIARHTKFGGRSYSQVQNPEMVIFELMKTHAKELQNYYNIKEENSEDFIEALGQEKKIFKKGGVVDEDKVSRIILKDWQEGKIKISH